MSRSSRKQEHIQQALQLSPSKSHGFGDIRFIHNALPELNLEDVGLQTVLGELSLSSPLLINAMTGGADIAFEINRKLAIIARTCGLAMAVGSQMSALKDKSYRYTYEVVRRENQKGIIFANIGAEATVEQARAAVDMIEANALQIHLNPVQELTMPEGDRQFRGYLERIANIVQALDVPVIVKEVGFGLNRQVARQLEQVGVRMMDVGGFGGTNFAAIENRRRSNPLEAFDDWGIKTVPSLIEVREVTSAAVIASGGIRSPLDVLKAFALGAKATAIAGIVLEKIHQEEVERVVDWVRDFHSQLKTFMCALGVAELSALETVPLIISGETYHWLMLRGYDPHRYANRDQSMK